MPERIHMLVSETKKTLLSKAIQALKLSVAPYKIGRHEGQRGGVRLAGGTCARGWDASEWVREALLSAPAELVPDSGEVALAEVLALRSLPLNLHFWAAKGEPVAEAETRGLIERADGSKMQQTRERLGAVQPAEREAASKPEWLTMQEWGT